MKSKVAPLVVGGHRHHRPHVLAAVAVQPTETDVDVAVGHGQGGALLDRWRVLQRARDVDIAGPEDRAGDGVEVVEDVDGAGLLRDHEDRLGGGVVGRGAGHAQREDVPAGQVGLGHRRAHVVLPHHRPALGVQRVEGVVLGGHDHVAPHDDRLGPDGPVQVGGPRGRQRAHGGGRPVTGRCARCSGGRRARRRSGPGWGWAWGPGSEWGWWWRRRWGRGMSSARPDGGWCPRRPPAGPQAPARRLPRLARVLRPTVGMVVGSPVLPDLVRMSPVIGV